MLSFKSKFLSCFINLTILVHFAYANDNNILKFNELWGEDLKSNNVSFQKYQNKLVLLYEMSPIFHHPLEQVNCLNSLYDEYHGRGLEIIGVSSAKTLLKFFDRRFKKFNYKFDLYSNKYASKNINKFLSVQPLTYLDHRCT